MNYQTTIGLEIHAELQTRTKMFCDSRNDSTETHPNVNICPICMGHPGTLPVINRDAVTKVIAVGLALDGTIAKEAHFERKNYFYPDLPKGYQISQYAEPLVSGGGLTIVRADGTIKRVRITRVHLEEDTGRSLHEPKTKTTLLDFNRAGIPLMELVTEPDIANAVEARKFAEKLQLILQYLSASDANMEKGQMRIEANVSLAPAGSPTLGTKVELKSINSFRFVEKAIEYEISRQRELLESGKPVRQETRGWDESKGVTVPQRTKEESQDYRYFPEPDLPPLEIDRARVEELRAGLPELPSEKLRRFREEFGIEPKLAETLIRERELASFFEKTVSELKEWLSSTGKKPHDPRPLQLAANYLTTDVAKLLTNSGTPIQESLVSPENFAELITYLAENRISSKTAKAVLEEMFSSGVDPSVFIEEHKLWQVSGRETLDAAVEGVIAANAKAAADYQRGKITALQFLVGQVMKEARGSNPEVVRKLLEDKLRD